MGEQHDADSGTFEVIDESVSRDSGASQQPNKRAMVLITLEQRAALLDYLSQQPYKDVAGGIDFLRQALTINVSFSPDSASDMSASE